MKRHPFLHSLCKVAVCALASFGLVHSGHAISIDLFQGTLSLTSSEVAGESASGFSVSAGAAGGDRQGTVLQRSTGKGSTRILITGGELRFTLETNQGEGIVVWDGDRNPNSSSTSSLGSIDLTQDGGSSLVIPLISFDLAKNKPISIKIALFDSLDNARFSEVTLSVNQVWDEPVPFPLVVPFAQFSAAGTSSIPAPLGTFGTTTVVGTAGPARLASVGAIRLHIIADAADLYLGSVTTNGRCSSVPNNKGAVIDACGVCFESPDANKGKDLCGVCFKGPPGYNYNLSKAFDACGLCPGQSGYSFPSGTKDSCGVCLNGQPPYVYKDPKDSCGLCPAQANYQKALDPCGVCFGNGSTCADCSGNPNGGTKVDVCGVCGGDGKSCLDCAGVAYGGSSLDVCGVCRGDGSSCLDCNGVAFGPSRLDACGMCGGNSTELDECAPVIQECVVV